MKTIPGCALLVSIFLVFFSAPRLYSQSDLEERYPDTYLRSPEKPSPADEAPASADRDNEGGTTARIISPSPSPSSRVKSTGSFSAYPLAGVIWGAAEELRYKYPGRDNYLSQLIWDLKPMAYIGTAFELSPRDPFMERGFFARLSLKFGVPAGGGSMEDRDWLADLDKPWSPENREYMTHFSRHDAGAESAFLSDIFLGMNYPISKSFSIKPYAKISLLRFSWIARDGFFQYPDTPPESQKPQENIYDKPWTDALPRQIISGPVVHYEQLWIYLSPGIFLGGRVNRFFSLGLSFNISPLVFCYASDDHLQLGSQYTKGKETQDFLVLGLVIEEEVELSFALSEGIEFKTTLSFRSITGSRGLAYVRDTGIWKDDPRIRAPNDAGAELSFFEAGLGLKFRF